jgi:hypothetical protein
VYLHTHCVKQFWVVQYLEADLKTPLGRMYRYTDLNFVRDILTRVHTDVEAWEKFESGIRRWGIGACFITLTPEQYKKLKASRNPSGR